MRAALLKRTVQSSEVMCNHTHGLDRSGSLENQQELDGGAACRMTVWFQLAEPALK